MYDMKELTVLILAGGLGARLRSVVADRPKVIAEVNGRPFLAYLLDQLASAGIERAILCTGYKAEQVQDALGDRYGALHLAYSPEPVPLGTGGALRHALPLAESSLLLAMNGDSFCQVDLREFIAAHRQGGAEATLCLCKAPDVSRFGQVLADECGRVTRFQEKGAAQGPGWINAGLYLVSRKRLEKIPPGRPVSIERELFPQWIARGLRAYRTEGRFLDIGTPESYRIAERFFRDAQP